MPAFCCVKHCRNRADKNKKSFFRLPLIINTGKELKKRLSLERREKWLAALGRLDFSDEKKTNWLRVCEDHFVTGKPAHLFDVEHPDWVPSLYMEYPKNISVSDSLSQVSTAKLDTTNSVSELSYESDMSDTNVSTSVECETMDTQSVECQTDFTFEDLRKMENAYTDTIRELTEVRDKVAKLSINEDTFKDNDAKTMNYTGMQSYEMLMTVFEMIEKDLLQASASSLSKFQRYILTLMRLRLNLDLNQLSHRFLVSKSTILKAFTTTIYVMFKNLEHLLVWPDRDTLTVKEPHTVRETNDQKVTLIINCFEIMTNRPQNMQVANTKKFLIGICPQSGITFISSSWDGDTPEEEIVQNCGVLEKLLPGDIVIYDQGFSIHSTDVDDDGDVEINDDKTHRQYTKQVISRLKQYAFLQRMMPSATITRSKPDIPPIIDQVVKVCCCLVNISALVVPFD